MAKRVFVGEGAEFLRREGLAEQPAPWEDGLRQDPRRGTFEWRYFDAHFDDGATAVIVYLIKPLWLRAGPLKPMVTITITRPDGRKLSPFPTYPPDEFAAARDRSDVRIGPSWVRGDLRR